jgi:dUTPase
VKKKHIMDTVKIKVVNISSNVMPAYATEGSSGMDLRASLEHPKEIAAFERKLVPTGLFFEIPPGYEGQVRPRSGLAIKKAAAIVSNISCVKAKVWKLCCPLTTLLLLGELSNALITNFHSGQCKS